MNRYSIPNLAKACEIMAILADCPEGITSSEIEKVCGAAKTTVFRILKTLCAQNFAKKRGSLFFAGAGLIQIGLTSLNSLEIRGLSARHLALLAEKTGFTAHIAIPSGFQSLILKVHDSPKPVRVACRSGTTVPLHCSSTGKVFLAYLYERQLEEYFSSASIEQKTSSTIVSLEKMRKEVVRIRNDGFAIDDHEFHEDVWCAAGPVMDSSGKVIAAIGVTGPSGQSDTKGKNKICMQVKKTAAELSAELGYTN